MGFGAKTVAVLVKEIEENPGMTSFEAASNASIQMNSGVALEKLKEALKKHKNIKKIDLTSCAVGDGGCDVLAEILKENHVIEELNLEKNNVGAQGAKALAEALAYNKGLRTLNLMQQVTKNFGEDTLEAFITMFNDNITLTKISWRLESRKSFMLNKLQTRNVEIKKRQDKGEDCTSFLPDHLKTGAAGYKEEKEADKFERKERHSADPKSSVQGTKPKKDGGGGKFSVGKEADQYGPTGEEDKKDPNYNSDGDSPSAAAANGYKAEAAPVAPAPEVEDVVRGRRRSTVPEMEEHVAKIEAEMGELKCQESNSNLTEQSDTAEVNKSEEPNQTTDEIKVEEQKQSADDKTVEEQKQPAEDKKEEGGPADQGLAAAADEA